MWSNSTPLAGWGRHLCDRRRPRLQDSVEISPSLKAVQR